MKRNYLIKLTKIALIILILFLSRSIFINRFYNKKETVVPNLILKNENEAIKLLKKAKLKYNIIYTKSSEFNEDIVFIQEPIPGSVVKINRNIQIWINKSDGLEIPNIKGKTLVEARRFLEGLNIQINRIDYMPLKDNDDEIVLAIYPKEGTKIGSNQKISLLISSKALIKSNIMPNLIGLTLDEAKYLLSQINKNIDTITDTKDPSFAKNVITATNPLPGEEIFENTKISIVFNSGIELDKSIDEIIEDNKNNETNKIEGEDIEKILDDTLKKLNDKKGE